jgi:hypothetical protein
LKKKILRLVLVTAVVGLIGWRLIRAFDREETMQNLRRLFGEEWMEREMLCAEPEHLLGKWYKKRPDNPVTRYTDELVGFVFDGAVKCDIARLADKLRAEFVETLTELGFAVFLAERGFQVTMEPTAPAAGPDLLAVKDAPYYVEVRKVGLGDAHAAADMATEDVFERLCSTPSRHSVVISMTQEYSAHSPELKKAVRLVRSTLQDLTERRVPRATLYYHSPEDHRLREGEEVEPHYDYTDPEVLALQIRDEEWKRNARFVARFHDAGQENAGTAVGVHPLGPDPHLLGPDETYLRLKSILKKKQKQLPKGFRGVILLEITDLAKLMVDEFTLARTLYGDLLVRFGAGAAGEPLPHDLNRKPNGFFMGTTRVSAVVIETVEIGRDAVQVSREVFPTNNPHARVLTLDELKLFGTIAEGHKNLCAEELGRECPGR